MRQTKNNVKREIKLAKRRLRTFKEHTGLDYELDEEHFLSLQPKEAIKQLKTIKWSNIDKKYKNPLKHVNVSATVNFMGKAKTTIIPKDQKKALVQSFKHREKITGKRIKQNIQSEKGVETAIKFNKKFPTKEDYIKWEQRRDDHALNNYLNNMRQIIKNGDDWFTQEVASILYTLINNGTIDILSLTENGANRWLWDLVAINMFDSDQGEIIMHNGKLLIDRFLEHKDIITEDMLFSTYINNIAHHNKSRIEDFLISYGKNKNEVNDILKEYGV